MVFYQTLVGRVAPYWVLLVWNLKRQVKSPALVVYLLLLPVIFIIFLYPTLEDSINLRRSIDPENTPSASQQVIPGLALWGAMWIATRLFTHIHTVRQTGYWTKLHLTPIWRPAIPMLSAVSVLVLGIIQLSLLFMLGIICFGMSLGDHYVGLLLVLLSFLVFVAGLGILMVSLSSDTFPLFGYLMVSSLLGGTLVPRFGLRSWMQQLSWISPHYWSMKALQDLMLNRAGLFEIAATILVLGSIGAIMALVGSWRLERQVMS